MGSFKDNKCGHNISLIENASLGMGVKETPGEPGVVLETKTNNNSHS